MSGENPGNQTFTQRMMALVGHSAEYSIAFALLAVCLVVGLAIWLLQPSAPQPSQANAATPTHVVESKSADEQAALGAWKQKLEGGFDQMDQKQRRAEEDRARQEQLRREDEADARTRRKVQQTTAATLPAATSRAIESTAPVSFEPPKPVVKAQAVRVDAAIDWTSCKRPAYPETSMRRNEQGAVTVDVDLDENARVLGSRVSKSSGFERLDTATKNAIDKCRFRAATLDGQPVASTAIVRFTWALSK